MEMLDAGKRCVLEKYATFKGRASRAEYWLFYAAASLASIVLFGIAGVLGVISSTLGFLLMSLLGIATLGLIIPGIAVAVRRMHDIGKSGWFVLICFVPLVGGLIFFYWTTLSSQKEANAYGEPPQD